MSTDLQSIHRLSKPAYFMVLSYIVSTRATCPRRQVGALIVDPDGNILSTGYNGAPHGMPHCTEIGCLMVDGKCVRTAHSETNAMLRVTSSQMPHTLFTTDKSCINCYKAAHQLGLQVVVYDRDYPDAARDQLYADYTKRNDPATLFVHIADMIPEKEYVLINRLSQEILHVLS